MKKYFVSIISLLLVAIMLIGINNNNTVLAKENFADMTAKSYIVLDSSGNVLMEKNANDKHEVASICKLMTTLITLEHIDSGHLNLDDKVVASAYACDAEGSQAFLDSGSEYSIRDLLKSVIVASANDSAIVLAESIGGSESNFVKMMNDKAQEIGMKNTLYANSTGLSAGNQYSTAYDTSLLLNIVSRYDIYREDCKIWLDKLVHPSGRETELVNTNRLIKYYPNCLTGKTGYTDEAGYCLSSTAEKNNLHLTCVVLGCDTMANRFKESMELYNYAFANFTSEKILSKENLVNNNIKVNRGRVDSIDICAMYDYYLTKARGENSSYNIEYDIVDSISAPIEIGSVVGTAKIYKNGNVIKEIPLISASSVEAQKFGDVIVKVIDNFNIFR